ncbi:receptor-type tyrosine-protein phosphatase delta-like [Haliotis asinina]|uniref:receptor-type tyrosine-protein phosphatase delta-like n=1 Tax=Haliotis asinina TaxID=109174 RepID=UPI003531AB7F
MMTTSLWYRVLLVEVIFLAGIQSSSCLTSPTPIIPGLGEHCTTECSPPEMVECVHNVCQCKPPLVSTGTFCVSEPGEIEVFNATDVTNSSVSLSWEAPQTLGVIQYYHIVFTTNGMCFLQVVQKCTEISRQPQGCMITYVSPLNDCQGDISYNVSSLLPYTNYSVSISARNDIYSGPNTTLFIQTEISAPLEPSRVYANVLNASTIKVSWTQPRQDNGPTWYNVTVWEATGRLSSNFSIKTVIRVDGFNTTSLEVPGLLSSWKYTFTVTAYTPAGSAHAPNASEVVMTFPAEPGPVENLTATAVPEPYFGTILTWNCPKEKQRNGRIVNYTIHYKGDVSREEHYGSYKPEDPCMDTKSMFVPMAPVINYTFTVFANAEFKGEKKSIISRMDPERIVYVLPARTNKTSDSSGTVLVVAVVCGTIIAILLGLVALLVIHTRILPSRRMKYAQRKESAGMDNKSYRSINTDQNVEKPYMR